MKSTFEREREEDLELRLRGYEKLAEQPHWPGAMTAVDYWGALAMTLVLLIGCYAWGV